MNDEIMRNLPSKTAESGDLVQMTRAMQEVQAAVLMARKFPRDLALVQEKALEECKRVTLAETAHYLFPRGGTEIEGVTIRLVEAIARRFGNMQYDLIEVSRDAAESTMVAYAWDLETNVMARQEWKVRHIRDTREGSRNLTDERDIYEATANSGSRRLRACILRLLPGDLVEACSERCKLTLKQAKGKIEDAVPRMLEQLGSLGITPEMIETRLKKSIKAIAYQDLVSLGNVYNSIKDGMGTVEDYFKDEKKTEKPASRPAAARAQASRMAGAAKEKPAETKAPEPPKPPEPQATAPGNLFAEDEAMRATRERIYKLIATYVELPDKEFRMKQVDGCKTIEELQALLDELNEAYAVF